jgi:CPA2 family monovalent cation:H+ antiporter-2
VAATINIPVYSDALVVLGTAGIVVPIVQRLGISPVLGYLAAGALLGPLGLGSFIAQAPFLYWLTVVDAKNVSGIADLGVVFLLFLVGLELSFERLMAMRRLVFGLGGLQILVSTAAIASIAALAGQTAAVAIMLGALLALSSTAVVLQILSEQGRMMSSTGRASFAVLLAQDFAVIPILMFVSILGANTGATIAASIGTALLQALAALAIIAVVGRIVLRPLLRLVAATRSNDLFIAVILFVIVATGVIAALAGLSMALGAFVAGLLLSETEYRKAIEATIEPFKGLLLGLFFFTIGMSIDAREVIREPVLLLGSVVGLVLLKALILVAVARLYRLNWPVAVEIGLLLGPGGEFAFVGIGLALALGLVPPPVASFTLAVTSLGMALIPLNAIVARRLAPLLQAPKAVEPELLLQPAQQQRHAIVIGYGRVGKLVCSLLREHGVPFTAVDNDPNAVARDRRAGPAVYFGDATQPAFLDACGIKDAAGVIVTLNRASIVDEVVGEVRHLRPDVLIVARARDGVHAQHLYGIGVTDAVPETIEASLQLSEAALVGLGVPTGPVIASLHEHRETVRKDLQAAARLAVRSRSGPQSGKV